MDTVENLNWITRTELLDTLKVVPSGSDAAQQLAQLLNGDCLKRGHSSGEDIFDIQFEREVLEEIAYAVEQYAYDQAGDYVELVEDGNNTDHQDRSFYYWQALSERWAYLELMR